MTDLATGLQKAGCNMVGCGCLITLFVWIGVPLLLILFAAVFGS